MEIGAKRTNKALTISSILIQPRFLTGAFHDSLFILQGYIIRC